MYSWLALRSSADLAQLDSFISTEYAPKIVAARLVDGISSAVKAVLIEHNYVDKDYRSTYYHFYSKKGQYYRPDCVRLHFFDATVSFEKNGLVLNCSDGRLGDHYFGYVVLRPTGIGTIGRSVLSPDIRSGVKGGTRIIAAKHKVHLLGHKIAVEGFPSMDQHQDISVCAHATCWSILRHYSERYSVHREYLTHDITMMAQQFDPGGLVPSKGLEISNAERVFQAAGTYPYVVTKIDSSRPDPAFYRQLIAYVESGFPLFAAMHRREHAIAVVGCEWQSPGTALPAALRHAWDELKALIAVDDNHLPYLSVPVAHGTGAPYSTQDIDSFIVALPEKIFYPADAVEQLSATLFKLGGALGLPPQDECIVRYLITTGSTLRNFVRDRSSEFDSKLVEVIMSLPYAQFIWVVEIARNTEWSAGQIAARAVVDATASLREQMPLWFIHSRTDALVFDRRVVGATASGMRGLKLNGMTVTALTRMEQNLRPTQPK